MSMTDTDEELIYGFDPLCGWCFAFRPTMHAIVAANPDLPITLLYGGLVVGERVAPISESRAYLMQGLDEVRRRANVYAGDQFYNGLLAEGTYISNSEPPCRAIYVVQQLASDRAYAFADSLPDAFYVRGLPLDDEQVLGELVSAHGIDVDEFLQRWRSDEAKRGTQDAFANARAQGISMYPTLRYRHGSLSYEVVRGFMPPADAVERVATLRSL